MAERQRRHAMLPGHTHDELARQDFARTFKATIFDRLTPGVRGIYEARVRPEFRRTHAREPADRHEVRHAMAADPFVSMWSALRRASQAIMWDAVTDSVERQLDDLVERARRTPGAGTLTLNPALEIPPYVSAVDVHLMPTGYWAETRPDDVAAGAIFDRGVYVYADGQLGALNDDYGRALVDHFLKVERPAWTPRRILEIGCTCGGSMGPVIDAYPDSEVHGVDVGAPVLRYAHARLKALGKKAHLHQMNGEALDFPDGSFDLVYSTILMHETSVPALRRIFAESYRVLAPGGLMVHADFPQYAGVDAFTQYMLDWDTYHNNEPCWGAMHDADLEALAASVGFDRADVRTVYIPVGRKLQSGAEGGGGRRFALTVACRGPKKPGRP